MRNNPIETEKIEQEVEFEQSLRPSKFDEFVGQKKIVENLKVFIKSARMRKEALDHCLFTGPPGLGKTTLAYIIANEMGTNLKTTSGPVLEKPGDLAGLLTNLSDSDVLFIDEIHRLSAIVEEYLYSAMEDFKLDIMIDSGPSARSIQLKLPRFTLIGATTREGLLTAPLRARFGVINRLDYYKAEFLFYVVKRSASILGVEIDDESSNEIAKRSRGTPRIANRLLKRTRDFAVVYNNGKINRNITMQCLEALEVDEHGLDEMDKRILLTIVNKYNGGPVGVSTIAVAVGEEPGTIEEVYEPFLIQEGFLKRTPRGREATDLVYRHFKIKRYLKSENLELPIGD